MDDLLSRMLEIEAQGNAEVKNAEEQAARIREESSAELARINSEFSGELVRQCQEIEAEVMAEARQEHDAIIAEAEARAREGAVKFAAVIDGQEERLYREVLGI